MKLRISSGEGSSGLLVERIMSLHPYPVLRNLEHEPYLEIPRTTYFHVSTNKQTHVNASTGINIPN